MDVWSFARRITAGIFLPVAAAVLLAGCNDKGAAPAAAAGPGYVVGGVVSGANITSLKLTNNGGDQVTLNAAGQFTFPARVSDGKPYDVRISQQPTAPAQTCTLSSNSGTVAGHDVTDVYVECSELSLSIVDVVNTSPGQTPVLTFKVLLHGAPLNILTSPLQRLRATLAGPTTDYAASKSATLQGSGATGTLVAVDAAQGIFAYTFAPALALSAAAAGSFTVALEGYLPDAGDPARRVSGVSPVSHFKVTDAETAARRVVVEDARCNSCHVALTSHGERRGVQYCATCHNPNLANVDNVARFEGQGIEVPSLDLKVMIHKIHRGSALSQKPYLLWGVPAPSTLNPAGTPHDYSAVSFPGDLGACESCHLPGTYDLPLAQNRLPTMEYTYACNEDPAIDIDNLCGLADFGVTTTRQTQPVAAACLSCHDAPHTVAHAQTMTTSAGTEACATCHAIGAANGIDRYHSLKLRRH